MNYAIIPANVRYDKSIAMGARLLYGEIAALCVEKGFCCATNKYFSTLYEVTEKTIKDWLSALVQNGYLYREIQYEADGKTVARRILRIDQINISDFPEVGNKTCSPSEEIVTYNNIDNINILNNNINNNKINKNNISISNIDNISNNLDIFIPDNIGILNNNFISNIDKDKVSKEEIENYFKYIYELYPRKVSKVQGKNTFIKKLQGIRKEDARKKAAEIYQLLERYNEAWKRENDGEGRKLEYIPYFSTWLNSNVEDSDKQ